jgi:transposase
MQGKVLPERSDEGQVYIGLDVCKAWLDVYVHPVGRKLRVENTREGLQRLRRAVSGYDIALVVIEATAKYHRLAHRTLHAWGVAVAIVNPLRSRLFAEAAGWLAKTDPLDARLLALFGESLEPPARPPVPEAVEELQELVRGRQAAAAQAAALANRRGASRTAFLEGEIEGLLDGVRRHIARLDTEIERRIADDPALARRYEILRSIPSFGPVTAAALTACLAELGQCSNKAIALLGGLAPIADDSGDKAGVRHIKGGRAHVRQPIYMAALSAIRLNPELAAFYRRLRANGKTAKVALTAVMRKLIVLANTLVAGDRLWQPTPP